MPDSATMPAVMWFRQDLRLHDNPAFAAAVDSGAQVVPVYILDDGSAGPWKAGGASRWWLHQSLTALDADLRARGFGPLIVLSGDAAKILPDFVKKHTIGTVYWNRRYEPWAMERDARIKDAIGKDKAQSYAAFLLFEPWVIKNKTGGAYKVFTPFSRAVLERQDDIFPPDTRDLTAATPPHTLGGQAVGDLGLMPDIVWYTGMAETWKPGEAGAQAQLEHTVDSIAGTYKQTRDFPALDGVSMLSPFLHFGEISSRQVWHAVRQAKNNDAGYTQNAQAFLRQLIWRDFSWYLLYHDPACPQREWNPQFRAFPWGKNPDALAAWQQGQTGYPLIDAGMRQLWQTGWMHNRVRMIVGSFLVKNLMVDWREGAAWFWDTLVDADLGNNTAGWQWIAGCGADAAPYFRIFNPVTQSKKFDPDGDYIRRYVPELSDVPDAYIHAPWEAPAAVQAKLRGIYPPPMVDLGTTRTTALAAYKNMRGDAILDENEDSE